MFWLLKELQSRVGVWLLKIRLLGRKTRFIFYFKSVLENLINKGRGIMRFRSIDWKILLGSVHLISFLTKKWFIFYNFFQCSLSSTEQNKLIRPIVTTLVKGFCNVPPQCCHLLATLTIRTLLILPRTIHILTRVVPTRRPIIALNSILHGGKMSPIHSRIAM